MNLFFASDIQGELLFLDEEESRHAAQVLRRRPGDALLAVDGRGGWYECTLLELGRRGSTARIDRHVPEYGKRPFSLHLAVAPTKNIDRFEWFLEKAAEIGVESITPLLCEHSERRQIRTDRLEKILLSAMKQSLKAYLPGLAELTPFSEFIARQQPEGGRYIAHLGPLSKGHLKDNYRAGQNVTILIGPEGDFSTGEIGLALERGWTGVSLGSSRLRTETAAVVACHTVALINE